MTDTITQMLSADHAEVDLLLSETFDALRTNDLQRTHDSLDLFWARLAMHIRAEHLHLCPALLEITASANEVIAQLRSDHDYFMKELAVLIKELRSLIDSRPADSSPALARIASRLQDLRHRLRKHNEVEEAGIYALIDREQEAVPKLAAQIRKELDNLPPRFEARR